MEPTLNRNLRDSVFRTLFKEPTNALSLYNALNHTSYTDESALKITTIEGAIYLGYRNDCSFLFDNYMVLYEHQSTLNPNMPLRGMIYYATLFEDYVRQTDQTLYGDRKIILPTPQYYVFYNGPADVPEKQMFRLSNSFIQPVKEGIYEWTCTMININHKQSRSLLNDCKVLADYCEFIQRIYVTINTYGKDQKAIMQVIDNCINENILKDFLLKAKGEIMGGILTEFDPEVYARIKAEVAFDEGKALATKQSQIAIASSIRSLVEKQGIPLEGLLEAFHMNRQDYEALIASGN